MAYYAYYLTIQTCKIIFGRKLQITCWQQFCFSLLSILQWCSCICSWLLCL